MNNKMTITIRAHHLLCFLGFRGVGYNKEFVENFKRIYTTVYIEDSPIKVVTSPDDICRCCPNLKNGVCRSEKKVRDFDKKVIELLRSCSVHDFCTVRPSQIYKVLKMVHPHQLENICRTCEWYSLGFCRESFFRKELWKNG